ncbi:MAG: bifunctional demethylmenaquinone methyltransferase/2-methoxy-6-polyprenyl-1,4-benzoquinol methylase UbiE [Alphaproteobacteria bacterium]|nr:bifunctional demethylmenaquinone methyltransferase/2-methoxy-6-polyprenyl-1,4-benzoquinol methylase UbiE [Alphaproteobacteria bacterium]
MDPNPESRWFGERPVRPEEKTGLVRNVFDSVAQRYDLMNDLMSGGLHRLWKDRFVRQIRPRPGSACLDVAGGTGDIAFRLHAKAGAGTEITICDINEHMLRVGRDRGLDKGHLKDFSWVAGNAESLPFPDQRFDLYTIAFGLRNVTRIDMALADAFRVLRPGGRFYCLEFSRVENPLLARLYEGYSFGVIPQIGKLVAGDSESYRYLVESIRKFPSRENLAARMENAGFKNVKFTNLSGGIVSIHQGIKA